MTDCAVPENIDTHPKEGSFKSQGGGGGVQKHNVLKESTMLNWNFWGVAFKLENLQWGVWMFSGTAQSVNNLIVVQAGQHKK